MGKIARITNDGKLLLAGEILAFPLSNFHRLTNTGDLYINDIVEVEDYYLNIPTSGRINIPYNPTLALSNTFSISMWVKFTARSGWKMFLSQGSWSQSWTFWQTSGKLTLTLNGSHYTVGIATVQTNRWNHVAVTYNNGVAKYYQDGVLIQTLNVQTGFSSKTSSLIFNDTYPISGSVNDIRIVNRVLTDIEINNIYNDVHYSTNDEILWLPLDEGEGNIAHDISGNGNNGTITNGGGWGSEPVNVKLKDEVLYVSELIEPDDASGSQGSTHLIAGTMEEGFFGEVPASELITGDALASECGISQGGSQFSSEGWLKFAYQGKVQFVAKKPIRHSVSWDTLNSAGCVYGDKTVIIDGLTYKVRLMKGANIDPAGSFEGSVNHNSEWNKLMLPIHIEAKDQSWAYPNNVEADVPYWGIDFTDEDLCTNRSFGNGSYSWCQEVGSGTYRIYRGFYGVSYSLARFANASTTSVGWRPVLELIS